MYIKQLVVTTFSRDYCCCVFLIHGRGQSNILSIMAEILCFTSSVCVWVSAWHGYHVSRSQGRLLVASILLHLNALMRVFYVTIFGKRFIIHILFWSGLSVRRGGDLSAGSPKICCLMRKAISRSPTLGLRNKLIAERIRCAVNHVNRHIIFCS